MGNSVEMRSYVFAFVVATVVSAACTPLARRLAFRLGAIAVGGGRNVHVRSTPRLGGVAMFFGFFAPLFALMSTESSVIEATYAHGRLALGMMLGGSLMFWTGLLDDVRGLRALHKLYAQVAAATLAFAMGFRIDAIGLPFLGVFPMGVFALPVTILWIVGVINAVNLIDGLDGLAAGVVFFAGLTNFVVAHVSGSLFVALTMTALMGSVIGFLFWNFNPAKIFMGDSGSYFLGFVLATSSLVGSQKTSTAVSLLVPILALGVPIMDTLFAMVRRYLERRPLFSPDRGHIHHRLLDMGLTQKRAVLVIYSVCLVFTIAAIGTYLGTSWQVGVALLTSSVVLIGLVRFVGYFEYVNLIRRERSRAQSRDTEMLRRSLPRILEQLRGARTVDRLWDTLCSELSDGARVQGIELFERPRHTSTSPSLSPLELARPDRVLLRYQSAALSAGERRDLVTAKFPIIPEKSPEGGRIVIAFRWLNEQGDVNPQTEVLLQVIVDAFGGELERLRSEILLRESSEVSVASLLANGTRPEAVHRPTITVPHPAHVAVSAGSRP